ncbi:MAG: AAA family ATPase, partial [Candidatus Peribacteraceae bacterium]|nr:AAA family ATPase [Candidatus Peribacteraceae bacterium]
KKKELANDLYSVFENDDKDWKHILKTGNNKVNDHLSGTGIINKYPDIKMNYVGRKYSDIVKGIELKRPIFKEVEENNQQYFELHQNGLGENNLIYTSVVLGDLINRCEDKELQIYNALLVEEPEAHLHPQYQNTFFQYLDKLQNKGLQIFITSHSPTITAKSSIKNLIVLQKEDEFIAPFAFSILTESDFSEKNKRHLRKFLDTTKSQMFFSNGVLLVEGIAEAILLPVLAEKYLDVSIDLEKEGIEIVNISGVAFEHFAKFYNNDSEEKRLLSRCAIITDSDPQKDKPKSDRSLNAEKMERNNLLVRLAPNTLEHDLFEESESNKKVMRIIYRSMHQETKDLEGDFTAEILMQKLKSNKDKGDFALELRDTLNGDVSSENDIPVELLKKFEVPAYLEDAIKWVARK